MTKMGSNQYFLRARIKRHSSATKVNASPRLLASQNWSFIDCGVGPGGSRLIQ